MKIKRLVFFGLLFSICATSLAQQATWPISGSTTPDTIAAQFGPRILNSAYDYHRGLDFRKPTGTPIYAPLNGTVVRVRPYVATGPDSTTTLRRFGNFIVIAHDDILVDDVATKNQTVYQHMETIDVTLGQQVTQGQQVGTVGSTGHNIYTEHLHFEWYHNKNNGDINRENARNPMEMFVLPTRKAAIMLLRKQDSLQVYVQSNNGYFGLNELVVRLGTDTLRHVHFEKKISINPVNEDENPYQGLKMWPDPFTHGSVAYGITFTFEAQYIASSDIHVKAIGVQNYAVEELFEHTKYYTMLSGIGGWRMLSLPVGDVPVSLLAGQNQVQGISGGWSPNAPSNFYFFTGAGETPATQWTVPENIESEIASGQGFIWYLYNNTEGQSRGLPFTLSVNGNLQSENVIVARNAQNDFTLIGNPFNKVLDASDVSSWGTLQLTAWTWDPNAQNGLGEYIALSDQTASFTGFFVEDQIEPSGDITIPYPQEMMGSQKNEWPQVALQLTGSTSSGVNLSDNSRVLFRDGALHEWDNYDASKMMPLRSSYAVLGFLGEKNGKERIKAVDSRPISLENPLEIPIVFQSQNISDELTITADFQFFPEDWSVLLLDRFTGEKINLKETSYTFSHGLHQNGISGTIRFNIPENPIIQASETIYRFVLTISPESNTSNYDEELEVKKVELYQNYPNPFNPTTQIYFSLPESQQVKLQIFDITGRLISVLVDTYLESGSHQVLFDGSAMASGTYFYRLETGNRTLNRKMVLIK